MKKLSMTVAAVAIAAMTLTGCVKETSTFKVTKSQKVTGELRNLIDNDFIDMMQAFDEEVPNAQDLSRKKYLEALMELDDEMLGDLPKGIDVKVVAGKNYSGIAINFDKVSFKAANKLGKALGTAKKPIVKVSLNKKKQVVLKYRITGLDEADEAMETDMPKGMKPRYKVTASFPGKVLSTNGKLKKRTVTWSGATPNKDKILTATSRRK